MKFFKIIVSVLSLLAITACVPKGMFAGNYEEKALLDGEGKAVVSRITGAPKTLVTRESKESVAFKQGAKAVTAVAKLETSRNELKAAELKSTSWNCDTLAFDEVNKLKESAQSTYMQSVMMCKLAKGYQDGMRILEGVVDKALRKDPVVEVAQAFNQGAVEVSREGTKKLNSVTGNVFGAVKEIGIVRSVVGGFTSFSDNQTEVATLATQTGNTTVGDISISSSQPSNNVPQGSSGDTPTGSTIASSPVRSGTESTTLVLGNNNTTATAFDNGINQLDNQSTQQLESSATGSITDDSKTNGNQVSDQLTGDNQSNDEDGIKL